ncbi:MAG: YciI family protein [Cytophagales bacterium]|nr:YciI family protein [Cytophagales bacterium]
MFIINLTYKVPLDQVDQYLEAHVQYLDEQYELGNFLASGPKIPRNGGVILSNMGNRDKVWAAIANDPFKINGIADYEVIEFIPRKTSEDLSFLQQS